ncbi:MAG: hypothetical protein K6E19_02215 [Lachnospiraceae bacterium]|nr:hypothetical protein [Lachnospiraceae bacterium]
MIYESSKLKLEEVGVVHLSPVGRCLICRDLNVDGNVLYTVFCISDHEVVRTLISLFEKQGTADTVLVDSFVSENDHIFVFPYRKERRLDEFYMGDSLTLERCEDICINVILSCMTSGLPWAVLSLVLEQGLLNLNKDDSVYLSYGVKLDRLNPETKEKDCVVLCAAILMEILESKASLKADSYLLLQKKINSRSYSKFTELYRDIRIAATPGRKPGLLSQIRFWFEINKDRLFGFLFWISLILAIVALAMLVSSAVFGDVPWLRFFINNFKRIGTESLLQ